jgi:hypothetical protein
MEVVTMQEKNATIHFFVLLPELYNVEKKLLQVFPNRLYK